MALPEHIKLLTPEQKDLLLEGYIGIHDEAMRVLWKLQGLSQLPCEFATYPKPIRIIEQKAA